MFPMHTVQTILEILPVLGRHNFQHHTGEKRLDPRQQNESAGDQRRESRHQSRVQILQKHRNKQYHRHRCQQKCQHAEEMHGFIVFIQLQHLADHAETVTVSIQLGLAALGTVTIFHHHILYLHVIVHRIDSEDDRVGEKCGCRTGNLPGGRFTADRCRAAYGTGRYGCLQLHP